MPEPAEPDQTEVGSGDTNAGSGDAEVGPADDVEPEQPNLIDRTADRLDSVQRSVSLFAVIHAVTKKYGEDRCGQLAMMLSYRGFFSLFPLLLAFVNIVGLLLRDNPELRDDLIDSTLASIPVVGPEIQKGAEAAGGSVTVVAGSILLSIWAGLGLLDVLQEALNTVWGVPLFKRPPWIIRRLRAIPGAVLIGACLVLSGASAWVFNDRDLSWLERAAGYGLPLLAGALCYLGLHWLLCVRKVPFRAQLPGAAFVGTAWLGLQLLGTWYVNRFVIQSSDTYGVFVVVFGLLSWAYLLGLLYLYGNELSSVLHDRLWPRSLTGRNLGDADTAAYERVVQRERRLEEVGVDVDVPSLPR